MVLAVGAMVGFAALSVARARSLALDAPDRSLSEAVQASWFIGTGRQGVLTVVEPAHSVRSLGSLLVYPLGFALHHLPGDHVVTGLLVVQAAALGFTVLPLWRLARRVVNLRVGATTALVAGYVLLPSVQLVNLAGFHVEALALPAFVILWYRAATGSIVRLGAAAAFVVACRADLALAVAALGVAVAFNGRPRAGSAMATIGLGWFVVITVWAPFGFGAGPLVIPGAFSSRQDLWWFLRHPADTLGAVGGRADLAVFAAVIVPLALLPLLSLRHLAPVLPLQVLYLLGEVPAALLVGPLAAPLVACAVVAAAYGLGRLGRPTLERLAVPPRVTAALVVSASLFFLLESPSSLYRRPWNWGGRDASYLVRSAFAAVSRPQDAVLTTLDVGPRVAGRAAVCIVPRVRPCPVAPDAVFIDTGLLAPPTSTDVGSSAFGIPPVAEAATGTAPWEGIDTASQPTQAERAEALVPARMERRSYLNGRFVVAFGDERRFEDFERELSR